MASARKDKPGSTPVRNNDLWVMLLCALRYAMGRQSYITGVIPDLYDAYKSALTDHQREQVAREVEEEVALCSRLGRTLGAQMDHYGWKLFAEQIRAEERAAARARAKAPRHAR